LKWFTALGHCKAYKNNAVKDHHAIVNWALPFLHKGSLEITLPVLKFKKNLNSYE